MDFMSNLKSTLNNECNVSVTENGAGWLSHNRKGAA